MVFFFGSEVKEKNSGNLLTPLRSEPCRALATTLIVSAVSNFRQTNIFLRWLNSTTMINKKLTKLGVFFIFIFNSFFLCKILNLFFNAIVL